MYVIKFQNLGYYAAKQPEYEWSFTFDINLAKLWKTKSAAVRKGRHAECTISYRNELYTIEEVIN